MLFIDTMDDISNLIKKSIKRPENKRIHSEAHALADEISTFFNEKKKFGMYLGVIKRIGIPRAREHFSSIRSDRGKLKNPQKLFMWLSRNTKPGSGVENNSDKDGGVDPPERS